MNLDQRVREVLLLLLQMSEEPKEVVQAVGEAELSSMIMELNVLSEETTAIHSDTDLSKLIDAIHHFVEGRPALVSLLLTERSDATQHNPVRSVSMADLVVGDSNSYALARAPQIRNAVIECREQLEAALKETAKHEQEKSNDLSHK